MNLAIVVSAIWFLAVLAGAGLGARAARDWGAVVALLTIALATTGLAWLVSPQPDWIGVGVAVLAGWRLIAPPDRRSDLTAAGLCLGLAGALHLGSGVVWWIAVPAPLIIGLAARLLAGSSEAKPPSFREAGLVTAALAAPVLGLSSAAVSGWKAAEEFNKIAAPTATISPPAWALSIVVVALVAGVVGGLWVHR